MTTTTNIVTLVVGILFIVHASGKLFRAQLALDTAQQFGYSGQVVVLGIFELLLGLLLVASAFIHFPFILIALALVLFIVSLGISALYHFVSSAGGGLAGAIVPLLFVAVGLVALALQFRGWLLADA